MADKSRTERQHVSSDTVATVLKRIIAENGREHFRGYILAVLCLAVVAEKRLEGWSLVREGEAGVSGGPDEGP